MEELYNLEDKKLTIKLSRKDLARLLNGEIMTTFRGNKIGMVEE